MVKTEFDDVTHIVNDNGTHWKITRDNEKENPIFYVDYYSPSEKRMLRTTYALSVMEYIQEKQPSFKFIRNEKEFLIWYLRHGN